MSKPDSKSTSRKDLHTYVLTHREDQEAFYAYVDKLHAEAPWIEMSALESVEDLENYPIKSLLLKAHLLMKCNANASASSSMIRSSPWGGFGARRRERFAIFGDRVGFDRMDDEKVVLTQGVN